MITASVMKGLKKAKYLKFKWLQRESNPQLLSSKPNIQPFSQASQIIELRCEYFSAWYIDWVFLSCYIRV